jgi:hypothetical protein
MIFDPEDIDKDGNARYGYMLNHNQMGLDLNSLVDAIELKPINEAYWAQKVGVRCSSEIHDGFLQNRNTDGAFR